MLRFRSLHRAVVVLLAIVGATASCGGSDDGGIRASGDRAPSTSSSPSRSPSPSPTCVDATRGRVVRVRMVDFRFVPSCLAVAIHQRFLLGNQGAADHTFTIPGTSIDDEVGPGDRVRTTTLVESGVEPATYRFFCRFHRSRGMNGVVHVLAA